MTDWPTFSKTLAAFTKAGPVSQGDVLFGSGLNLSSIGFTEFIMVLEEEQGIDIDVDQLDASISTAGQLYERIFGIGG